jgi:superoxide dismutase
MIAVVADTVDIDAGNMAAKKTKNKLVREFAKTMVRDHTAVNAQATALAKKLGVIPEESDISKSLKSGGDDVAGFTPVVVMDVWEHAFLLDYKPAERPKYIEAFFSNIDWNAVDKRLQKSTAATP